jgi:lipoprotein NlpD
MLAACGSTTVRAPVETRQAIPARTQPAAREATAAPPIARQSAAPQPAAAGPTAPQAAAHTVKAGETLYRIAVRNRLDYRQVAGWNGVRSPYRIYPGQHLRLSSPASTASAPAADLTAPAPAIAGDPGPDGQRAEALAPTVPEPGALPTGPPPAAAPASEIAADRPVAWTWPAKGRVMRRFTEAGSKGLDIAGRPGAPVRAAAAGRVVYSGSGLVGYGKLIIVRHNNTFLSAYAHNERLLVKEGESVASGQHIAHMGQTGAQQAKLHFEIRRDGKPVDPLKYLPRQ